MSIHYSIEGILAAQFNLKNVENLINSGKMQNLKFFRLISGNMAEHEELNISELSNWLINLASNKTEDLNWLNLIDNKLEYSLMINPEKNNIRIAAFPSQFPKTNFFNKLQSCDYRVYLLSILKICTNFKILKLTTNEY